MIIRHDDHFAISYMFVHYSVCWFGMMFPLQFVTFASRLRMIISHQDFMTICLMLVTRFCMIVRHDDPFTICYMLIYDSTRLVNCPFHHSFLHGVNRIPLEYSKCWFRYSLLYIWYTVLLVQSARCLC